MGSSAADVHATAHRMAEAASRWLEHLTDGQRDAAVAAFGGAARREWSYLPGSRRGVALAEMDRAAAKAALRLLATGLSPHAFAQAATVIGLEDVLDEREDGRRDRHRGDYWVVVFGDPGGDAWGWRFEGHHLSVNHTVGGGDQVRGTPLFLGANPACTAHAGDAVVEPLGVEEALGFALLEGLLPDAARRAVVSEQAPSDIVTGRARSLDAAPDGGGVGLGELPPRAADLARRLLDLYLDRLPPPVALAQRRQLDRSGGTDEVRFAWAGGRRPGEPHYYRLSAPRLVVELDNTRDGANHVHSVLRDPAGDFGEDVLAAHLAADHA